MEKSSSTYDLFMERFPALGLMSGTWEKAPLVDEAIENLDLGKVEVLYVYGLSIKAYFQCKEWLIGKKNRQLVFLENVPGVILSFLEREEAEEILENAQVHLELFSKGSIENLASRFPVDRIEVVGLPSKGDIRRMRLKILRKTALTHALQLDRLHGFQPFANFVANLRHLPRSFYANGLKGKFQNVPAVVCGAGPSLQKSIEVLKKLENRAMIIAGGSTIAALSSKGIIPHFGMAVDPNLEEYRRMKNSFAFDMPLLYSTRVHPDIFRTCNGPFGYMRTGIGGAPELWLEEELGLLDPLIGDFLSPEAISVTSICIAWAQYLGCNPIVLDGIDMAYTGNRRYASGVTDDEEMGLKAIDAEKSAPDRILRKKDRQGRMVYTAVRWVMESASISYFAKKHPEIRFINATEGGIGFKGITYTPLEEAVKDFKRQSIRKKVEEAIAASPMPDGEIIQTRMAELKESLNRVVEYLQIIVGEKKGSAALAELELKEEIAFLYLFYDIEQVLKADSAFWHNWLRLAIKYKEVLQPHS